MGWGGVWGREGCVGVWWGGQGWAVVGWAPPLQPRGPASSSPCPYTSTSSAVLALRSARLRSALLGSARLHSALLTPRRATRCGSEAVAVNPTSTLSVRRRSRASRSCGHGDPARQPARSDPRQVNSPPRHAPGYREDKRKIPADMWSRSRRQSFFTHRAGAGVS